MSPLRSILTAALALGALAPRAPGRPAQDAAPSAAAAHLEAALEVAAWLRAVARDTPHGVEWPVAPEESPRVARDLYSGTPGVILFLLELARATGDERHLARALAGADELAAHLGDPTAAAATGLYTGLAGQGFTLLECWRSSGAERYRAAAERCCELLHAAARETAHGRSWSAVTDLISGDAGTGLFLLDSSIRLGRPQDYALAVQVGRHLLALGRPKRGGLEWRMSPDFPRRMPNLSHGTAGVGYFLARLFEDSGERAFLDGARAAAELLQDLDDPADKGLRVYHHAPGGEELYYYGWCHGPPGTARLFEVLRRATGEERYAQLVAGCALAVRDSGLPDAPLEGFWNNVGPCCGSAGVATFLLEVHAAQGRRADLRLAERLLADLLARGTRDADGLRWVQAEHRVRPELLQAQTGLMQGAAGVGLALLRAHQRAVGATERVRLPDDPF